MNIFKPMAMALALAGVTLALPAFAQSTRNIAPNNIAPPPQPCIGFNCNQPPPPPNYGQIPPCYAPNVLVQINEWNGVRYECRFVQVQPVFPPPPPPPPPPQQFGGQFSPQHYAYCSNKYKSYKPATNSYTAFSGQTKYCNSPFN